MMIQTLSPPRGKIQRFLKICCLPALVISWLILSFYAYYGSLMGQTAVGWSDGAGHSFGQCFINFWCAAKLAATGRIHDIYSWEVFHAFEQSTAGADLIYYHYSYPPVMPLLTLPLSLFPYAPAFLIWVLATWACFYGGLRAASPPISAFFLSFATPAFLSNLAAGQNGMLTAALLGGGLALLPKRPVVAGILFGLLCFKPQLGFLVPVALIAGKQWRVFAVAAATTLVLVALSLILYGPGLWGEYAHTTQTLRHYVLEDNVPQSWNQFVSVFVSARQFGLGITASYIVQGLFALGAVIVVAKLWASDTPHDIRCAALVLGTFMATPYAMDYDLVIMAFVMVWLGRSYRHPAFAITLLLLMPLIAASAGKFYAFGAGPFLMLPACLLVLSSSNMPWLRSREAIARI